MMIMIIDFTGTDIVTYRMHVGSMESNVGTIAITVAATVLEAERLRQNMVNNNYGSGSGSSSYDQHDDSNRKSRSLSSGGGNIPSIRLSHDNDVESGAYNNTTANSATAATTTPVMNTHLSQRERKISQKLNPNGNPDHPYAQSSNNNNNTAVDTSATTASTPTSTKERKKVLSSNMESFEISDPSASTDRKSKSKK